MAKAKRGPIDYIRKRSDGKLLWFRYQFPAAMGWKAYEKSLGTRDMKTARERAASHLTKCVAWVEEFKSRSDTTAERKQVAILSYHYPPELEGRLQLADGRTVQIKKGMCLFAAPDGEVVEMIPNLVRTPVEGVFWTREEYQGAVDDGILGDGELLEWDCPGWRGEQIELPDGIDHPEQCRAPVDGGLIPDDKPAPRSKPRPCADDEFLEVYLKHRNITGYSAREAHASWADFRMLTEGKPLKDCDRGDGRMLVDYYFSQGNKRATVQKKIMYLSAMVNLAMDVPKPVITFNPFSKIIPVVEDAVKREPMPEEDLVLIRENESKFDREEWLLYVLCATTGMRREEAFSIERDRVEAGVRYVIVGEKTKQSKRRVPLPDAVIDLPGFPARITKPLFAPQLSLKAERDRHIKNLGREVLRQMARIGVEKPGLHVLRHRAKDRLRAAGVRLDQQYEVLGHEKKTVAAGYGHGSPMPMVKEWIEKIGY